MPQKVLLNFSDEQITKLGACKTAPEFQAAIDSVIEASGAPKTEQKVIAFEDVQKIFAATNATTNAAVTTLTEKVTAVDNAVKLVDPAAIKASAEAAGSLAASKALGKVGASGAGAINPQANEGAEGEKTGSAALIAEGKYKEAYAADAKIRQEFSSAESYEGYMKASSKGRVQISGKN